jgi:hypothetical protein
MWRISFTKFLSKNKIKALDESKVMSIYIWEEHLGGAGLYREHLWE